MNFPRMSALMLLLLLGGTPAGAESFTQVRDRVFQNPQQDLPNYPGLKVGAFIRALLDLGGALVERVTGTLSSPEDFKERKPKILHPMGICAEATWAITEASPATGLFAPGTVVKGIARLSTGDKQTAFQPDKKRIFGLALKLFPTQDDNQSVDTRNLFLMDQAGLDGDARAQFLGPLTDRGEPVRFQNLANGRRLAPRLLKKIFSRFDWHPELRPLSPFAAVDAHNQLVTQPFAPKLLFLIARPSGEPAVSPAQLVGMDFRDEFRGPVAAPTVFDIVWPAQDSISQTMVIGTLTLGAVVISTACDQELHFHHHPN